jgi:hypothetical protein
MDIDMDLLTCFPVPDYGLKCPVCSHALAGLPDDRCPECGERFNLREELEEALPDSQQARREVIRILAMHASPDAPVTDDLVSFFAMSDQLTIPQAVQAAVRVARERAQGPSRCGSVPAGLASDAEARALVAPPGQPFFTGNELPLPDFGFVCRECNYELRGLPSRRCPECGSEFDPQAMLGDELNLQVTSVRTEEELRGVEEVLNVRRIPYTVAKGNSLQDMFGLAVGAKAGRIMVPRDYYFDALWWLRHGLAGPSTTTDEAGEDSAEPAGPAADWTCPSCGEVVPGDYEMCWSCCTPR